MIHRFHALNLELGSAPGSYVTTASVNLLELGETMPGAREVREAPDADGATLIIIDTIAASFPGIDENLGQNMGGAVVTLRSLAAARRAVLCIHHTPKVTAAPRGHRMLLGDAGLLLLVEAKDDDACTLRTLKNRNGPWVGSWRFWIRGAELGRDAKGNPVTAPLAEIDDTPVREEREAARLDPNARKALRLLFDLLVE